MNDMIEKSIKVSGLSKSYKLYDKQSDRLKEVLNPFKKKYHKDFYALSDISFDVNKGETVGIIGKNGSGKSTLLKIITGVLTPTSGELFTDGKIFSLLELGAGFNPEYTGVQNVHLSGTIMGYSEQEMNVKMQDVIDFADIGDFINQPVKNYSSGMYARLAFAVAINVDPEILIIDEALSVGDMFFQNKCFKKLEELQQRGITILFVSHDISSIKKLCNRVLWISNGEQIAYGEKDEVCIRYYNEQYNLLQDYNTSIYSNQKYATVDSENRSITLDIPKLNYRYEVGGSGKAEIVSFFITDENGMQTSVLEAEKSYDIHMYGKFHGVFKNVLFGITMETEKGTVVYSTNNYINEEVIKAVTENTIYECIFTLKLPKLQRGKYLVSPAIAHGTQDSHSYLALYQNAVEIFIENSGYNLALIELENEWSITKYSENQINLISR
ncbi:ABC transporter ATP-binding protein [Paenibacillus glucanolyticus]|jgi:teichoic acid transport system ATP-binding protein|uniref:ABC transporter ATP-binding protein n=3 Tax=Paenibacillus TaxID=44249 RepID=UPI0005622556|nr:ABC transporter ATP-binding protein [Paenibacillus glucanolyticus]